MKSKILIALTLILIPSIVYAYFFDTELSTQNTFSATTLDSQLAPEFKSSIQPLTFEQPTSKSFKLSNIGQLRTANDIELIKITDEKFASKIFLEIQINYQGVCKGYLNEIVCNQYLNQDQSTYDAIGFIFTISKQDYTDFPNSEVTFVIVNHAYQPELTRTTGFHDTETYQITLQSTNIVPSTTLSTIIETLKP